MEGAMRAFTVFACIKTTGSLTDAIEFHKGFVERRYAEWLQGQTVEAGVWQASSDMLADLEYVLQRQGETGHPICFEFVEKVLSEEGAPKTAYAS